jgi:hypothetical protein
MDVLQVTELDTADISLLVTGWIRITHQLSSQKHNSFDSELKMIANKEIVKGWANILYHHCIKAIFHAKPMDIGDPSPSTKLHIDMILVMQGVILSSHQLKFNDDIFLRQNIMCKTYSICLWICEPIKEVQGNALNVQESPVDICPFNLYLPAM